MNKQKKILSIVLEGMYLLVIFAYMLKPENFVSEAFGLEKEILLAVSPYDEFQPRSLQAVNLLFNIFPFKNRIDTLNCFVISIISAMFFSLK